MRKKIYDIMSLLCLVSYGYIHITTGVPNIAVLLWGMLFVVLSRFEDFYINKKKDGNDNEDNA